MRLRTYFNQIEKEVRTARFLSSCKLTFEERPPCMGFIEGILYLLDGSELHFTEFIDAEIQIQKINYSYHYMHKNRLVFRYDNASDPKARKLATYPHHKHLSNKLLPSQPPEFREILEEITSFITL
ncbi:MAG: hypothetical protein HY776_04385 [Actinobacteria bacterium]|nr:hypothetical protein [Actinomycetota bacterium]